MSAKPRGDGGDTIVELAKGRMLDLGANNRRTLGIVSSGST
jgi:hypothetical protein